MNNPYILYNRVCGYLKKKKTYFLSVRSFTIVEYLFVVYLLILLFCRVDG